MAPVSDVELEVSTVADREGRMDGGLTRDDCICPVCLEIFMEPVTLPCTHTFCKRCFLESVDKATLCCPMCRKRVSSWVRLHSRNRSLVNQDLWRQIQTCFPLQCQRRLSGQDATSDDDDWPVCVPRLSEPGELRQEYEIQISKLTEERRLLEEQERRASEEFIQKLLQEEEQLQEEEARRRQEDEQLAQLLSDQLNSVPVSQVHVPAAQKKKEVTVGQMDRFLCPRRPSASCSLSSNKENILHSGAGPLPPELECDGAQMEEEHHLGSQLIRGGGASSAKRKSSDLEEEEEEEGLTKRGRHLLGSSFCAEEGLQGIADLEAEQRERRQQEEEDRRLALLLQKELDEEERRRATDRRKGSADAYLLRGGAKVEARAVRRSSTTSSTSSPASVRRPKTSSPSAVSLKTTKTSSSVPSSSSSRCSKQTTLTEMFSSLSS